MSSVPRSALAFALAACMATSGCTTWRRVPDPIGPALARHPTGRVLVVVAGGDTLELRDPWVRNDSLMGQIRTPLGGGAVQTDTVRVALADVASVRARRVSLVRSGLAVVGVAAAGFLGLVIWYARNYEG